MCPLPYPVALQGPTMVVPKEKNLKNDAIRYPENDILR